MVDAMREIAADKPVIYVDDQDTLQAECEHLAAAERFGLDTEFVGERSYLPQLEIVQVATDDRYAIIDCRAVADLEPLFRVLSDGHVEKIFHAGQQDLELFGRLSGRVPVPIFDTQVAAAMVGYGAQPGYAALVERLCGVTLEKTETLTDWSRRPLTRSQLSYAVDDVRYLLPLYRRLRQRLMEVGRWSWLEEELRRIEGSVRDQEIDPGAAYLRVRGRGTLRAKGLAVLRELASWREERARDLNRPRASIVRDEALVEIARRAPTSVSSLRGLRAVRTRELDRHADEVVARVQRALALPKDQWPTPPVSQGAAPAPGVIELMQAVLRARAEEVQIAPGLLASSADLQAMIQRRAAGAEARIPLLEGWRRNIVGDDLEALLEGRAVLEIDPKHARIRMKRQS